MPHGEPRSPTLNSESRSPKSEGVKTLKSKVQGGQTLKSKVHGGQKPVVQSPKSHGGGLHEVRQSSSSARDIGDTQAKSENIELLCADVRL